MMDRFRTVLRTALVWAMLPLTAFSGAPRSFCLCSNGDVKLFCKGSKAERTCCQSAATSQNKSVRHSCCHRPAPSPEPGTTCLTATCRCTALIALPDTPPKLDRTALPDIDLATNEIVSETVGALPTTGDLALAVDALTPGSRRDLITLLSRLVI
jgi:hypothetical protein